MTPAMLLELKEQRALQMELAALPVDKLHFTYVNAHRDPGEKDSNGNQTRPPADPVDFETIRTYYGSRSRNLAAKSHDKIDHSLWGANANREAFEAWAGASVGAEFIPTKED